MIDLEKIEAQVLASGTSKAEYKAFLLRRASKVVAVRAAKPPATDFVLPNIPVTPTQPKRRTPPPSTTKEAGIVEVSPVSPPIRTR